LKCLAVIDSFAIRSSDRLRDIWKDLNRMAAEFDSGQPKRAADVAEGRPKQGTSGLDGFDSAVLADMTNVIQDDIERSFFRDQCSLRGVLTQNSHLSALLIATMREAAKKIVRKTSRQSFVAELGQAMRAGDESKIDRIVGKCLASIRAVVDRCGGATRLLMSLPDKTFAACFAARAQALLDEQPTLACDPQGEMIAAYEIDQVPLEVVMNRLIRSKPDCESLASRLHTRTDVCFRC
jgi:hypothetical protein